MRFMTITISQASHDLIVAHKSPGKRLAATAVKLPDGRVNIAVDEEVYARLQAIDPDPDKALVVLFGTGVGHA